MWGAYIRRGLCTEGNLRFKIDWASLILGRKFTVFLCFTLYLRAISKYKPPGGLYLEGRFNGRLFPLVVWGAYIWTGLYMEGLFSEFDDNLEKDWTLLLCFLFKSPGGHAISRQKRLVLLVVSYLLIDHFTVILAFEWMWGWGWPCFDTTLFPFLMEIMLKKY